MAAARCLLRATSDGIHQERIEAVCASQAPKVFEVTPFMLSVTQLFCPPGQMPEDAQDFYEATDDNHKRNRCVHVCACRNKKAV